MNTFAYDFFESIEERWREIDLLIENAKDNEEKVELYNVCCRAAVILMVANLEGFIKEVVNVVLKDINTFSSFADAPDKLKITFCNLFIDIEKHPDKAKKLISQFDELNVKFKIEPFLFDNNKNPSPSIIDKICNKFGIHNFFPAIEESNINIVFENDRVESQDLIKDLREVLLNGCVNHPYNLELKAININLKANKNKKKGLWEEFLDELLRKRHSIAHGSTLDNEVSLIEISQIKQKVQILQYIFAIILLNSSINKNKGKF